MFLSGSSWVPGLGKSKVQSEPTGSPLELIVYDEASRKFEVGQEAIEVLKRFPGPMGVVAVCGRARTGKSYVLNMLVKATQGSKSKGFQVSPTTRPCTKGLWIWSTPQEVEVDNQKYHMLLLDTEGIDANDQTNQYSTQIFCLAVLLSSLFVYNHVGNISEGELDKLDLITQLTSHIRTKTDGNTTVEELGKFTPAFLWLLRDVYLALDESCKTPLDYLNKQVYGEQEGPGYEAKNEVRRRIKQLFPQQDICALLRPVFDETQLQRLQELPESALRPEFVAGLKELKEKVMKWSKPQMYNGMTVTGPILATLVKTYVDAMNTGVVPSIGSAWEGVQEIQCRRAFDDAERKYKEEFKGATLPPEDSVFQKEHERAFGLAKQVFEATAVSSSENTQIKEAHWKRLIEMCETHCESIKHTRTVEAENQVLNLINNAQARMHKVLGSGSATLPQLEDDLNQFLEMYQATATGPTKWMKLAEFLKNTFFSAARELLQGAENRGRQQLEEAARKLQEVELKVQAAEQQVAELSQKLSESNARASETNSLKSELAKAKAEYDVQIKSQEAKIQALETSLRDNIALGKKTAKSADEAAKAAITQQQAAERELSEMKSRLDAKVSEVARQKDFADQLAQQCESLAALVEDDKAQLEEIGHKYAEAIAQVADKDRQIADLQQSIVRLQADVDAAVTERDHAVAGLSQHQSRQQEFASTLDDHMTEAQMEAQAASSSRSTGRRSGKTGWEGKTINQLKAALTEASLLDAFWGQNLNKSQLVQKAQELLGDCPPDS